MVLRQVKSYPDDISRWPIEMIKKVGPLQLKERFPFTPPVVTVRVPASGV
jgi:hypothetical protein